MQPQGFGQMYGDNYFGDWELFTRTRKPIIAALAGFALGGGCELAMICDFILAADTAKFGQPEIKLRVGPGMGGSQRLTPRGRQGQGDGDVSDRPDVRRGRGQRAGLVSRIVPAAELVEEAIRVATQIPGMVPLAVKAVKELVDAFETPLSHDIRFEPPVPRPVRDRGPEGRHRRVCREAQRQLKRQIRWHASH